MTVVAVVGDVMDDVLVRAHGPVTPGSDNDSEIRSVPGGRTAGCTIVFPNATEARLLSCTGDDRAAASPLTVRYPLAVVTRGRDGAVVAARGTPPVEVPAVAAEVVDTTGAGDAFCAGFLAAHLAGAAPEAAARAGVETAAKALSRMGARPPMP